VSGELRLARTILQDSFGQLHECGAGRAECVVYWCASLARPRVLTRMVHPLHHAGYGGYEVDSAWVTGFFLDLLRRQEAARVQVHTHPGEAHHSRTDDRFSLVPAAGFLSLVIPRYAAGPPGFDGAALVRMQPDGTWAPADPGEVFEVE
jgi:hypothetical protein